MDRFSHFLPEYHIDFRNISQIACNQSLAEYRSAYGYSKKMLTCYAHTDCILEHTTETRKAIMASAGVVLGLMPLVLATIAPSIAETSQLSLKRPFLSLLISLGVPAVYPSRILEYNDPRKALEVYRIPEPLINVISRGGWVLHAVACVVVLACIANIWEAAVILSRSTILTWECVNGYMPLAWVAIPVVLHVAAAVPFALSNRKAGRLTAVTDMDSKAETTDNHPVHWFVVLANCAAGFVALLHSALGTYIFSSLLFVSARDAWVIIIRFIASAFFCRVIVVVELVRLREGSSNG